MTDRVQKLSALTSTLRTERNFEIPFPNEQVWEVFGRLNLVAHELGLPDAEYEHSGLEEGGNLVVGHGKFYGMRVEWEELPSEWRRGDHLRLRRLCRQGPFEFLALEFKFHEVNGGHTRMHFVAEVSSERWLARWLARQVFMPGLMKQMERLVSQAEDYLNGRTKNPFPTRRRPRISIADLDEGLQVLRKEMRNGQLCDQLGRFLQEAPDESLKDIRPLALAWQWNVDSWSVLDLFYHASCAGLLNRRWRILCPRCRQEISERPGNLGEVPARAHCGLCDLNFDAYFDQNIELVFSVDESIRRIAPGRYCLEEPMEHPHVLSQLYLNPGQRRTWQLPFLNQKLRLRSPQIKTDMKLEASDEEAPVLIPVILCDPEQFQVNYEYGKVPDQAVQIMNPNAFPVQVILERADWDPFALTAAFATNWQLYRNLFPGDIVGPQDQIKVESQLIVIAELHDAASIYERLGSDRAYAMVKSQTRILTNVISEYHGAVVKPMGDGVMAVFNDCGEAIAAAREMHLKLPLANPDPSLANTLRLKTGIHRGPCLVVNAGKRMDFFGSTVNLAMRLMDFAQGNQCVLSEPIFNSPETAAYLREEKLQTESLQVTISGIKENQSILRVHMPS